MFYEVKLLRSRRPEDHAKVVPPAGLPGHAVAFVARRPDRPERLAIYTADGRLSSSFARDEGAEAVRAAVEGGGFTLLECGALLRAGSGG